MSGEINANLFLIYKGASGSEAEIAGQGEFTLEVGGEPIELTNKSSGNWRQYLEGSTTTKSVTFTGTITFSDDAAFNSVLTDADTATADDYVIKLADQYTWEGQFIPNITAYNSPLNDAVTVSIQFLSKDTITFAAVTP